MITCCRLCNERHIGCHSACQRYIKEAEANTRRLEANHAAVELAYGIRDTKMHLPKSRRVYAARG